MRTFRTLLLMLLAAGLLSGRPAAPPRLVLVELYTSEGCSSCPAADDLLRELAAQPAVGAARVVALGFHVDYWNRLGWKDAYADKAYTQRQNAYAARFGNESVYTPQAVVGGAAELVGSKRAGLVEAIAKAAEAPAAQVQVRVAGTQLQVEVSAATTVLPHPADIWLAVTESGIATAVRRGENGGRTLRHAPVVRSLTRIGRLGAGAAGGSFAHTLPAALAAQQQAVVFVQAEEAGPVVGVGVSR